MSAIKKCKSLNNALLTATLLLQSSLSFADDTEMFLSRGVSDVKPNVFFILDDSTSMNWCMDNDWDCNDPPKWADPKKYPPSRIKVLKETLNKLLPEIKGVRFGMMALNNREKVGLQVGDIESVRAEALKKINESYKTNPWGVWWTPIDHSLYDAARYFNGFKKNQHPVQKNFPGRDGRSVFGIKNEKPELPSPIIDACQPTHFVLLTDGDAYYDDIWEKTRVLIGRDRWNTKNRCVEQPGASSHAAERCVPELAEWLHTQDQTPLQGSQTITTHVISLAPGAAHDAGRKAKAEKRRTFLNNITSSGGGLYKEADDAKELTKAFTEILEQAADVENATFVNPGAAGSSSSQTKDQIYYPLFRPTANDRWPGNVKRYRLDEASNTIVDVNNKAAFDSDGNFSSTAQSFWSQKADGASTGEGGAASRLPDPAQRRLYHSQGSTLERFDEWETPAALKSKTSEAKWFELMHYISGEDDSGKRRQQLGDPLHSSPVALDYADKSLVVVGTNEGFVHFFNRDTGVEEFAFMPEALLENIKVLHKNEHSTHDKPHPYGMDNTVTLWIDDKNNNARADSGEAVYAYASMRRGGRNLYALDISDLANPKLAWQIIGGSKGFERLGQSWSQPVKTKINIKGTETDVLIFGGGYDPVEDDFNDESDGYAKNVQMGNDIYIVNAKTGKKLWSASDSNLDLGNKMQYSIPARLRVIDNNKGLAEQFFAADTGGQLWRFVIDNEKSGDDWLGLGAVNGVFASLGADDTTNARRFYHEPDVALDANNNKFIVNIGSGYHAHPFNTHIEDRFYSLHTERQGHAKAATLTENNLADITQKLKADLANAALDGRQGWYIKLQRKGEKVMSSSVTVLGELFFNTYVPTISKIGCQVTQGSNFSYRVFAQNGTPAEPDTLHPDTFKAERAQELQASGLATTALLPPSSNGDIRVITTGKITPLKGSLCDIRKHPRGCKTFWMELDAEDFSIGSIPPPSKGVGG